MSRIAFRASALALAVALSAVVVTASAPPAAAWVSGDLWDPGYIISDGQFFDASAMSVAEIQAFLNAKVPVCHPEWSAGPDDPIVCLKDYRQDTISRAADAYCPNPYVGASDESAATIIYKVAQACNVSPKVILVTLQKEMGLVTHTYPSTFRYDKAMGYGCPDTGTGCIAEYFGFQNQVWRAARQFHRYVQLPANYNYRAGVENLISYKPNTDCGTETVYIQNSATAALYNYTPYVPNAAALAAMPNEGDGCSSYGNRNFWMYYWQWFGDPTASLPGTMTGSVTRLNDAFAAQPTAPRDVIVYSQDQTSGEWLPLPCTTCSGTVEPQATAATDSAGTFSVGELRAGGYKVGFRDFYLNTNYQPAGTGDPIAFYGGTDLASASVVSVVAGAATTGINVVLQPYAPTFTDVPVTHPFSTYIEWFADQGITSGYADGRFGVADPVTRGQMAVFMYRLAGSPAYTPPASANFTDVPTTDPFFKHVSWLAAQGITNGYADGRFGASDPVTRGQMAVFMYRLAGSPAYTPPATSSFTDVPTTDPFFKHVSWLAAQGITNGYADGSFGNSDAVTRGQMAVFMYRYAHLPV